MQDLLIDSPIFSRIMEEYGTLDKKEAEEAEVTEKDDGKKKEKGGKDASNPQSGLMQAEERLTGSVANTVYLNYFRYAGGAILIPTLILLLTLYQTSQGKFSCRLIVYLPIENWLVANNLFLGFWTSDKIHTFSQGDYMATYAALGVASALFSFALSFGVR